MGEPVRVVGAGVSGLTCAVVLAEAGNAVEIKTLAPLEQTTSFLAAAVWYPESEEPRELTRRWAMQSYEVFARLCDVPEAGVDWIEVRELLHHEPEEAPPPGVTADRLESNELPSGYRAGVRMMLPRIDPTVYLPYLRTRAEAAGASIEIGPGVTDLADLVGSGGMVVNCTGLGARELVGDDELFAIRGQVVAVAPTASEIGFIDESNREALLYSFPRRSERILGGTRERGNESLAPDPATTRRILEGCSNLSQDPAAIDVREVRVGLRPGRTSVRVELEPLGTGWVVHNYGHAGNGYTLSWGCAHEVAGLVAGVL